MPKISALPAASSVAAADLLPIVQGGTTKKATFSLVLTYIQANITISDSNLTGQVSLAHGGTNKNMTASNGAVVYSDADSLELSAVGSLGQLLRSNGAAAPTWSTATFPATGGAAGNVLISDGTNYISSTSLWPNTVGAVGKILRSDGTTNAYTTATFADTYAVSTLLYASGANAVSGLATVNSAVLATSATGVPTWLGSLTNGQIIIGSTGAIPVAASLTAGANITITPGAGSITIASSGNMTWTEATGATQAITVNNGYIANRGGGVAFSLPASSAVGDTFSIVGKAGVWSITQGAGQQLNVGATSTTVGAGGSLTAANAMDSVQFVCITANTIWNVIGGPQTAGFVLV